MLKDKSEILAQIQKDVKRQYDDKKDDQVMRPEKLLYIRF